MAPPPEYDKEPKAPDKSATTIVNDDSKLLQSIVTDQHTNSDHKPSNTAANTDVENNKQVVNLDDGQLRALLDEAMNYKCPKDLEGKSNLFKELLEEVEQQDDQASEAAARGVSAGRGARRAGGAGGGAGRSRHALHSNSLQDLVAALAAESAPRRPRHHAPAPVSARAIQGGSLPSGVDTSFLLGEEGGGARYLATVRCVNPPPLAERRVSASDANCPAEVEPLNNRRSKPVFPMTYTARATLEIGSGSVCSGRAVTTTTASNQGDSAIPFSCITTPEVVASCNTTSSTPQSAVAVDPKPLQLGSGYRAVASLTGAPPEPEPAPPQPEPPAARQLQVFVPRLGLQPRSVISSSFNGLPLTRPGYGTAPAPAPDDYKKSLDENGNAVQGFSSPVSGSSQHKKPRRKKSSKNETVITSHQIDGYQGNKDLNEVLRFIESNADAGRGKLADKGKKRSTERRKDKDKPKRASSLEELSRTKLEDLTAAAPPHPPHPPRAARAPATKPERRSWGDDARPAFYSAPDPAAPPAPAPIPVPTPAPAPELTDFQTVTKRRKPRRRTDEAEREPPRRPRPPSPSQRPRRESAPPSDRSNDSNDDLDSVHSLPAAPAPSAARPPPAPHASYADIARTRHNIPDLIESCNFYAEGEAGVGAGGGGGGAGGGTGGGAAAGDAEYPALGGRARAGKPPRARPKERPPPPDAQDSPAPDVVGDRRPAVILADAGAVPRELDGVTFGFDINETLLCAPARRPRCDLVRDALEVEGSAVRVAAGGGLRYVAPAPPRDTHHLHQIIDYVGNAWEDVVRCGGGKVRYFSE